MHAAPLSLKTLVLKEGARTLVMHRKGLMAFLSCEIRAVGISDEEAERLVLKVVKERVNLDDGHNLLVMIPSRANEICGGPQEEPIGVVIVICGVTCYVSMKNVETRKTGGDRDRETPRCFRSELARFRTTLSGGGWIVPLTWMS